MYQPTQMTYESTVISDNPRFYELYSLVPGAAQNHVLVSLDGFRRVENPGVCIIDGTKNIQGSYAEAKKAGFPNERIAIISNRSISGIAAKVLNTEDKSISFTGEFGKFVQEHIIGEQ